MWRVCPFDHYDGKWYEYWKAERSPADKRLDGLPNQCGNICFTDVRPFRSDFIEPSFPHRGNLNLGLLRTCWQTYTEANDILWKTNTFALEDVHSLHLFLSGRNGYQRQIMQHLSIDVPLYSHWKSWCFPEICVQNVPYGPQLNRFRALKTLHLNIAHKNWEYRNLPVYSSAAAFVLDGLFADLLRLQECPLETVTVSLDETEFGIGGFGCANVKDFAKWLSGRFRNKNRSEAEEQGRLDRIRSETQAVVSIETGARHCGIRLPG